MLPFLNFGRLSIPTYGLMLVLGVLAGLLLLRCNGPQREISKSDALYCAIYALIGALIGSKLLYLLVEMKTWLAEPRLLLTFLRGGAVFYGGLLGGLIGGAHYANKYHLHFLSLTDVMLPCAALGQAFGRVGCLLAGCCYGRESNCALSVVYPVGGYAPAGIELLPVQLFESLFLLLLSVFLSWLLRRTSRVGAVTGAYLTLYALVRFVLEFLRADPRGALFGLSTSQWISLLLLPIGLFFLLRHNNIKSK